MEMTNVIYILYCKGKPKFGQRLRIGRESQHSERRDRDGHATYDRKYAAKDIDKLSLRERTSEATKGILGGNTEDSN